MMTSQEAMAILHKQLPNLVITRCIDYNERHFVIEAVENLDRPNYNNPFYGVDKNTGKITGFKPNFNLDAFFEAVAKRTVYSI